MTRVERQIIRKSHPLWGVIDDMCFKAKNLYNYANYILRKEYIKNNRYISYQEMNKELKSCEEYKACMSQPANCILRLLDKNWKSYFQAIKQYSKYPNKFLGKPNIPIDEQHIEYLKDLTEMLKDIKCVAASASV